MSGESYCPECSAVFTGLPHQCKSTVRLTDEEIQAIHDSLVGQYAPITIEMQVAQAQLKKVFELVDKIYDEPDEHLALAYLHKTLLEEVK